MNSEHPSRLGFAEQVRFHFSFLEAGGFECVDLGFSFVRFEIPHFAIHIYLEWKSYEIGLELVALSNESQSYSFSEALRLLDEERAASYRDFAATTPPAVSTGVKRLADDFIRFQSAGLLEDANLFHRLEQQHIEMTREYLEESQLLAARRMGETAWRERDYATVINTLKPWQNYLTKSEKAKLDYAEKHANQSRDSN